MAFSFRLCGCLLTMVLVILGDVMAINSTTGSPENSTVIQNEEAKAPTQKPASPQSIQIRRCCILILGHAALVAILSGTMFFLIYTRTLFDYRSAGMNPCNRCAKCNQKSKTEAKPVESEQKSVEQSSRAKERMNPNLASEMSAPTIKPKASQQNSLKDSKSQRSQLSKKDSSSRKSIVEK